MQCERVFLLCDGRVLLVKDECKENEEKHHCEHRHAYHKSKIDVRVVDLSTRAVLELVLKQEGTQDCCWYERETDPSNHDRGFHLLKQMPSLKPTLGRSWTPGQKPLRPMVPVKNNLRFYCKFWGNHWGDGYDCD